MFCFLSTHISDGVQKSSHGLPPLEFSFLHGLQFNKHGVNLGNDAADGVFHAVHAATETEIQITRVNFSPPERLSAILTKKFLLVETTDSIPGK